MTAQTSGVRRLADATMASTLDVHLIDGTYELFRHYYALPSARDADGREVARRPRRGRLGARHDQSAARRTSASRPITSSSRSATACGPATRPAPASSRTCSRSFRCSKRRSPRSASSSGRWSSSRPTMRWRPRRRPRPRRSARRARDHLHARQGPGAVRARHARRADESPARARSATKPASIAKFGVPPASIPDYLALVGDAPDGYPGPARLGREVGGGRARAATAISNRFPPTGATWGVNAAKPGALARDAGARARSRVPVPRPRDAADRHPAVRHRSTSCAGRGRRRRSQPLAARFDGGGDGAGFETRTAV